jgi:Na+/H+-translocating membrane pyrophosphatase
VTQLALLLTLSLIGVVLSFGFGRMEVKRAATSTTVKRIEGALERAAVALLRQGAGRAFALVAVPALGLSAFVFLGTAEGQVSAAGRAAFVTMALVGGVASALVQARLVLGLGARAAASAASSVARGSARGMRPLLRAAAAMAVFGDGLGLLTVGAAFASLYAIRGGFAAQAPNVELAREIVSLLPAFALGSAVTALVLSREGGVAAAAARVGGGQGNPRLAGFDGSDARDPALLATLVGQQVGELLPRAMLGYVCGVSATISVSLLAASGSSAATLSSLVLLLLVRAFGIVGTLCGVLGARVTEEEPPSRALFRAKLCALTVTLFGLGAALFWLSREHLAAQLAAGSAGLLSVTLVALLAWLPLRRGSAPGRELSDAQSSGDAGAIVRGAGSGLSGSWPALLVPCLSLAALEYWLSPATPADLLTLTFAAGALSLAPFAQAVANLSVLSTHARGVATLARLDVEAPRRTSRLDDVSTLGGALGSTYASVALSVSVLLGLVARRPGAEAASIGVAGVAVAAGVSLVLVFGARAARAALSGSRLVSQEVERQLGAVPRQHGVVPVDFTPSYKPCVDASLGAARSSSQLDLGALVLTPFVLAALLYAGPARSAGAPLTTFAVAALTSGVLFALGARATRAALIELRRRARTADSAGREPSSLQAENFGELVGVTAASSVEALALVLALTVLCLAPLFG